MEQCIQDNSSIRIIRTKVSSYLNTIEEMINTANEEIAQARSIINTLNAIEVDINGKVEGLNDALTVEQAAEVLQLSTDAIYKMAQSNKIPAVKIQEKWRFSRKALTQWLYDKSVANLEKELEKIKPSRKPVRESRLYTVR